MGKDYLGKDQRSTRDEEKDDKPIQGQYNLGQNNKA